MYRQSPTVRLLLLTTAFTLSAAAAKAESPVAAAEAQPGELQEVVVTAQRREETAQHAATALSVVSPSQIERAGVLRPEDLSQVVPALQSSGGGGSPIFYIRGVGTLSTNSYTDPAVAFNYDDVYVARPTGTAGFFYDLERVEVLKGPQGTLYGRNATGGAINVIPTRPVLGHNDGNFTIEGGNYDHVSLEGAANLSLGDKAALRVAGTYLRHAGYNSDGGDGEKDYAGRAQISFVPTGDLSVRLATDYAHIGGAGVSGMITDYVANADYSAFLSGATSVPKVTPAPYPVGTGANDPRTAALLSNIYNGSVVGRNLGPFPTTPQLDMDQFGANAHVDWKVGAGTLVVIPAYRYADLDNRDTSGGFITLTKEKDKQSSIEARFASPQEGMLRYLVGGYYFDENIHSKRGIDQFVLLASQDIETSTKSGAAFGRLTIAPTDPLRFVLGARYTRDHKTFDADATTMLDLCTNSVSPPACPAAPLMPAVFTADEVVQDLQLSGPVAVPGFSRSYVIPSAPGTLFAESATHQLTARTDDKTTWHGGVEYDLSPSSLLYANVETGFHSGGFSVISDSRSSYAPETVTAYTVGSKNRFLHNRLQVNLEAFLWKYKNQQVSHFTVDANTHGTAYATENIGRSTNKGAEVDVQYLVTPSTLVGADVQYLHARYDSFKYINAGITVTGCNVIGPRNDANGQSTVDCSGRQAIRSPEWTLNLNAQQTFQIGDKRVIVGASTHYQSSSMSNIDYLAAETVPNYWRSNAFATYQWGSDLGYELTAFVNNIEGDRPATVAYNALLNTFSGTALPPRTYGVRLRAEF